MIPQSRSSLTTTDGLIIVVDASYVAHRARHSTGDLRRSGDGLATGVSYGVLICLMDLIQRYRSASILFAFDSPWETNLRRKVYPGYKAARHKPTPSRDEEGICTLEELNTQLGLLRKVLSSAGFPCVEVRGYEADDICAWATRFGGTPARTRVRLVSRDADLYQLLHLPWVSLYDPQNRAELTGAHVQQKYGVPPARFRALKVLMGCNTDNIPHPAGLGEVTAAKIVNQSLKGVLRERWTSRLRGEKGVLQLSARLNHLPFEGFDRVAGDLVVALPTLRQVQADPILEFMKEMEMEGLFEHASEFWRGLSSEGLLDQPWNQRRIRVEPPMGFVDLGRFYGRA